MSFKVKAIILNEVELNILITISVLLQDSQVIFYIYIIMYFIIFYKIFLQIEIDFR